MSTWIPTSERLPTREDANKAGEVLAVDARGHQWLWNFSRYSVDMFGLPPVAWVPTPPCTPPKPGPTDAECAAFAFILDCITSRDQFSVEARRWFADVTARIERERRT